MNFGTLNSTLPLFRVSDKYACNASHILLSKAKFWYFLFSLEQNFSGGEMFALHTPLNDFNMIAMFFSCIYL